MVIDHYAVLGVDRTATAEQIRSAYRGLVKQLHPDTYPPTMSKSERDAGVRRFRDVRDAYEVLTNDRDGYNRDLRRAEADQLAAQQRRAAEGDRRRWHGERAAREAAYGGRFTPQPGMDARVVLQLPLWLVPSPVSVFNPSDGFYVQLPPNAGEGTYRYPGRGFPGPTGWRGDLIVDVVVLVPRRGADLRLRLRMTAADARAGVRFRSPLEGAPLRFDGPVDPGEYRFGGFGDYGSYGGARGDLVVLR